MVYDDSERRDVAGSNETLDPVEEDECDGRSRCVSQNLAMGLAYWAWAQIILQRKKGKQLAIDKIKNMDSFAATTDQVRAENKSGKLNPVYFLFLFTILYYFLFFIYRFFLRRRNRS